MATKYTHDQVATLLAANFSEAFRTFWSNNGFAAGPPPLDQRIAVYATVATGDGFTILTHASGGVVVNTYADIENDFWQRYTP